MRKANGQVGAIRKRASGHLVNATDPDPTRRNRQPGRTGEYLYARAGRSGTARTYGAEPKRGAKPHRVVGSDGFLEFLGGPEGDLLARLDLDRLAGRRIAAHAGLAVPHLQDAEPADADLLALLQAFDDETNKIVEDRLGLLFRDLVALRKLSCQMLQGNSGRCLCHSPELPLRSRPTFGNIESRWRIDTRFGARRHTKKPLFIDIFRGNLSKSPELQPQSACAGIKAARYPHIGRIFHGICPPTPGSERKRLDALPGSIRRQDLLHEDAERVGAIAPERPALLVAATPIKLQGLMIADTGFKAKRSYAFPPRRVLEFLQDRTPDAAPARDAVDEHPLELRLAVGSDDECAAADGALAEPGDEETHGCDRQRCTRERVPALRRIERVRVIVRLT